MALLKNQFSWSKTRDEVFRACPRKYWFQYYGSWGGWDQQAPDRVRETYILKQLTTRHMWVGSRVHACIQRALENMRRNIKPMSEQEAVDITLALMRKDFSNSRRAGYRENPKTCGLLEHEYSHDIPEEEWKALAGHAAACLKTFYGSDIYAAIMGTSVDQWLEIEKLATFDLEGVRVYVSPDFSCRAKGGIIIYDWKTGRTDPESSQLQLACYSFYAIQKWKAEAAQVTSIAFNLANGKIFRHVLTQGDLDSVKKYILGSVRDMKLLLDDADANLASEDRFTFTDEEKECGRCNFKKVCPRWGSE